MANLRHFEKITYFRKFRRFDPRRAACPRQTASCVTLFIPFVKVIAKERPSLRPHGGGRISGLRFSYFFGGREATTENTSSVRRLRASLLVVPVDSFFSRAAGCFGVGRRPTNLRLKAEATSSEAKKNFSHGPLD